MNRTDVIKILSREKECVQSRLNGVSMGGGYVSPDGIIKAMDYVEALSIAIDIISDQEALLNKTGE